MQPDPVPDPHAPPSGGLTREGVQLWMRGLIDAWETGDPCAAAARFAPDVSYAETPFAHPLQGRDEVLGYWRGLLAGMTDVHASFEVLAVDGDTAVLGWRARYRDPDSDEAHVVDGVSAGRFEDGQPVVWREWWHKRAEPVRTERGPVDVAAAER